MRKLFIALYFISSAVMSQPVKYISLGDSYTIGTGVDGKASWPVILSDHLNKAGIKTELTANPSRNGFTTQDVIDLELPVLDKSGATFVTVLIGVNDWVRGVNTSVFHNNLIKILDFVQKKIPDKTKVLLVTIPDFGVTPAGKYYANGRNISAGISEFNDIIKQEARERNLPCVDIFDVSKEMGEKAELVASDGLHPSAAEYAIWEKLIFPEAKKLLSK